MTVRTTPELLAPAGTWEALRAAAANGADAVYFGVEAFNARMRAANFRSEELPAIASWLHRRGIKAYLTLNVLVFSDELAEAASLVLAAAAAGIDALIVQDVGLARLAHQLAPQLAVHASTQMSITSTAGVVQAVELGCRQVVLARELSLDDLGRIQRQLHSRGITVPLEVFVHGALCVAYSGQCLTSEALGERSANRGECAQACRLPYQLVVDGEARDLGEQRYLLSPQDLAAWDLVPRLAQLGIASLKIEGRLKDATYVAAVTGAYRRSLDGSVDHAERRVVRRDLELSFSRGLSTGWLEGVDHRQLVHGRWSKKRGPRLGSLRAIGADGWWLLRIEAGESGSRPLKPGDGVVFEAPGQGPLAAPEEVGGRVMAVQHRGGNSLAVRLGPGRVHAGGLVPGSPCWLTSDPERERVWQKLAKAPSEEARTPLHLRVWGRPGEPLQLQVIAGDGQPSPPPLASAIPLQSAQGSGLDQARLEAQLGRLGGTPWQLARLTVDLPEEPLFLPVAELNRLRRRLVEELAALEATLPLPAEPASATPSAASTAKALQRLDPRRARMEGSTSSQEASGPPQLVVLVRTLEQLLALQGAPVQAVVADLEQPRELKEAVAIGRGCWPGGIWLAGARICRPDEAWSLEPLLRARPDGYLVRNADQLERLTAEAPCIGDFSLNTANPISVGWFLERWGLRRVTASYDLDLHQLLALLDGSPRGSLEITIHQHMPLFHMEHCLFCAFLSDGHDHTDCGRPCEQHSVVLRDRSGAEHPLRADLGCRNTLFNARAQTGAEALPQLLARGACHFRVELLEESGDRALQRARDYAAAIAGTLSGRELWQRERLDSRLGVTRGTLAGKRAKMDGRPNGSPVGPEPQ